MKIGYVYLLVGRGEHDGVFKIGYSADPFGRQAGLEQEVDLERSVCVGYEKAEARENERWLHKHFDRCRIVPDTIGEKGGRTEWFSMQCFDAACEIMRLNPGVTGVQPVLKRDARLNVQIPDELHLALKLKAIEQRRPLKDMVVEVLSSYVSTKHEL